MYKLYDISQVPIAGQHWVDFFKANPRQCKLFLYQSSPIPFDIPEVGNTPHSSVVRSKIKQLSVDKGLPGLFLTTYLGFNFLPLGLFFRAVAEKMFHQVVERTPLFYVAKSFDDAYSQFSYGEPIVLVEGILDAEAFYALTEYPFIIAYLTSSVSVGLSSFLSVLTDKVVVVPDSDKWGIANLKQSEKNLKKYGVNFKDFILPRMDIDVHDYYVESSEVDKMMIKTLFETIY